MTGQTHTFCGSVVYNRAPQNEAMVGNGLGGAVGHGLADPGRGALRRRRDGP